MHDNPGLDIKIFNTFIGPLLLHFLIARHSYLNIRAYIMCRVNYVNVSVLIKIHIGLVFYLNYRKFSIKSYVVDVY